MVLSAYDCEILKALFKWIPSSKCVCVCVYGTIGKPTASA